MKAWGFESSEAFEDRAMVARLVCLGRVYIFKYVHQRFSLECRGANSTMASIASVDPQ